MKFGFARFAVVLIVGVFGSCTAQAKTPSDDSHNLSQISSIRSSLSNAGNRPVHILYVHGIGATGAGGSRQFQKSICHVLKDCTVPVSPVARDYADNGVFENGAKPPALDYMGRPVWPTDQEWRASAPFVDHYVLQRTKGGPIVVDEINWWPLVRSLKCRHIIADEADLSGPDEALLNLCSHAREEDPQHPGRFKFFTWISAEDANALKSIQPKGALFNRKLKNNILDWGFSDAVMAVGSMRDLFLEGIRQLFVESVKFHADGSKTSNWEQEVENPRGPDRDFIVVSHSLGSYLIFSTLNFDGRNAVFPETEPQLFMEDKAAQYIFERTSLVYFFANQVPLLELATLGQPKAAMASQASPDNAGPALSSLLSRWKQMRQKFEEKQASREELVSEPPQLIAWSDPSDLLTWHVPKIDGLVVRNIDVRNTRWHWLIAGPESVHDNYDRNKNVLRVMFGPKSDTREH